MRVVVIGASGHIGSFLVPRLVRAGHEVVAITRGRGRTYTDGPEWQDVRPVHLDRVQQDAEGSFGDTVLRLRPDVVIDLLCFTLVSAVALVDALRGEVAQLVHCGSVWRYGASRKLPIAEGSDAARPPLEEYGDQKARIARMLQEETAGGGLTTTSIHPGHIVGPGWLPIGPLGNLDASVWHAMSAGRTIHMPGSGAEMLHHVHADDVAQALQCALMHRDAAAGEDFNIVAPAALSVRGYAEIAAGWFGRPARLEEVGWTRFRELTVAEHADVSWSHLHRSQVFTIEKARALLGYRPRYQPETAILESIRWLIDRGRLPVAGPLRANDRDDGG